VQAANVRLMIVIIKSTMQTADASTVELRIVCSNRAKSLIDSELLPEVT
jgi:hypothetical protein